MTAQPIARPTAADAAAASPPSGTTRTGATVHSVAAGTTRTGATMHSVAGTTRPRGPRGRALLAALGVALAAAVLPVTAVHASPEPPGTGGQLANPGGNPQPPEPPDVPDWGPKDVASPTDDPEPPLPPDPPDVPDWGPGDVANPTENPEPPLPPEPPGNGPDGLTNPTESPNPPLPPNPNPDATGSDSFRPRSAWTPASAAAPPGHTRLPAWPWSPPPLFSPPWSS